MMMQAVRSKSGELTPAPNVYLNASSLCQLQISVPYTLLGEPNLSIRRSMNIDPSETDVPLPVVQAYATDSEPCWARRRFGSAATPRERFIP